MATRVKVAEFGIINKNLANAVVTFYVANADGSSSGVKATLFSASTGGANTENPQTLDENGKLPVACYVESAVVASISGINERTERAIKKIAQNPEQYQCPITSALYSGQSSADSILTNEGFIAVADDLTGPDTIGSVAAIAADVTTVASIASDITDVSAISADISTVSDNIVDVQNAEENANTAVDAANTATTQAGIATAAAAQATQAAASGLFTNVEALTFASSPYVPALAKEGTLFQVDTSGGDVVINLSSLATYGEDMKFAFTKMTADANTVTINRGGTDTIDGATSYSIPLQFGVYVLIGDLTSGKWSVANQAATIADLSITFNKLSTAAIASQAEAEAGTATDKLMTPERVAQAIAAQVTPADISSGTFTPTWTSSGTPPAIGNGILTGNYTKCGDMVMAEIFWQAGSTTTYGTGDWAFGGLPFPAPSAQALASQIVQMSDAGTAYKVGYVFGASTTSIYVGTTAAGNYASATVPHTWANNDLIYIKLIYRAA